MHMPMYHKSSGLILTVVYAPPAPHEINQPRASKDLTNSSLSSRQRRVQVQCT